MSMFDEKIDMIKRNYDYDMDIYTVIDILEELKQYYEPETNN